MAAIPTTSRRVVLLIGTTMGELFYSSDDGETWQHRPAQFPLITSIKTRVM